MHRAASLSLMALGLVACAAPLAQPDASPSGEAPSAAALAAQQWQLTEATDASGRPIAALAPAGNAPLRFEFGEERLVVSGGCNQLVASYSLREGRLESGPVAQTKRFCGGGALMAADEAVTARLAGPLEASLENGRLVLVTAAGDRLVFDGAAAAQAR